MPLGNFGVKKIGSYFTEGPYCVPDYQRDYSWEANMEVKELWEDIVTVKTEELSEYFLGQLVVHDAVENDGEKRKYIIDGQQRTITLLILLLAIKNKFNDLKEQAQDDDTKSKAEKGATKIVSMLGIIDKDDNEDKLFLGETERLFFRDNLIYSKHSDIVSLNPRRKARKNLINAYRFFFDNIEEYLGNDTQKINIQIAELKELYAVVTERLKLLYVETTDEGEAFMIFETLNARGRDLETSDLLKNYLFRISKSNLDIIKAKWQAISDEFATLSNASITNYIRCLWNLEHEYVREKMLYKKITTEIKTPREALEFANHLEEGKDLYLSLLSPDMKHAFPTSNDRNNLEEIIQDLSDLNVKTYYPVVLAYYFANKESQNLIKELIPICEAIEKLVFRDIVIAQRSPAAYERYFAELAVKISEMEITDLAGIEAFIKEHSIPEDEFKALFTSYVATNTPQGKKKVRYIFRRMINHISREMQVKRNNDEVHIEHIMPQTKGEWLVTDEEHESNLWRLGNLVLLDFEINEEIKNSLYDKKCIEYKKSEIKMVNCLPDGYPSWDVNAIQKRQSDLYEIAKELWGV